MLNDELLELCKTHPQESVFVSRLPLNKDKKNLILETMQSMQSKTTKHWPDCIDHVKGIEVDYWASDIARDEMPEPVVIISSATDTVSENEDGI